MPGTALRRTFLRKMGRPKLEGLKQRHLAEDLQPAFDPTVPNSCRVDDLAQVSYPISSFRYTFRYDICEFFP